MKKQIRKCQKCGENMKGIYISITSCYLKYVFNCNKCQLRYRAEIPYSTELSSREKMDD